MRFCPQCHLILESVDCGPVAGYACRSCGGCWFPSGGLASVISGDRQCLGEIGRQFPGIARADTYAGLQLTCPDCKVTYLERQPAEFLTGAMSPVCPKCGGMFLEAAARASLLSPDKPIEDTPASDMQETPTPELPTGDKEPETSPPEGGTGSAPPLELDLETPARDDDSITEKTEAIAAVSKQIEALIHGGRTSPVSLMGEKPTFSRWCPQCRKGFAADATFCPECTIGLAEASYKVKCLACGAENSIGNDSCWVCRANLHELPVDAPMAPSERMQTDYVLANRDYVTRFEHGQLPIEPARKLAIVTCMDARMQVYEILGLKPGDANVIRNAGGIVTEDVLRSLIVSNHLLGTKEVVIINHTDCGLLAIRDEEFSDSLTSKTGIASVTPSTFHSFTDLEANVRRQIQRVRSHPWIPGDVTVRGFVYDVETGRLSEVDPTVPTSH